MAGGTVIYQEADDTVNNSTTLTDSSYLTFTAGANKLYAVFLNLGFFANTASDAKFGFTGPSGYSGEMGGNGISTSSTYVQTEFAVNGDTATMGTAQTERRFVQYGGHIRTSDTAGAITLQFAQNTAFEGDTDLLRGSYLIYWEP